MFVIVYSTSSSSPRVISNVKPVVRDVVETLSIGSSMLIPGIEVLQREVRFIFHVVNAKRIVVDPARVSVLME